MLKLSKSYLAAICPPEHSGSPFYAPGRADRMIELTLVLLVAFMPWTMGVVEPWSKEVVMIAATIIGVGVAINCFNRPPAGTVGRWLWLPIGLFLFIVTLQLIPLPRTVLNVVSPHTTALRAWTLAGLPDATVHPSSATLSLYPFATRHDLFIVCFATVLFSAVVDTYRSRAQIRRLLLVIALVGAINAILALTQYASGTRRVYWIIPTSLAKPHGSFINYSNFAQFLNLSLGAAFSLLFTLRTPAEEAGIALPRRCRASRTSSDASGTESHVRQWRFALSAAIAFGLTAIFLSSSRGGMIGAISGLMVMGGALFFLRPQFAAQRFLLVTIAFLAFAGLVSGGFDFTYERLATFWTSVDPTSGRAQIYWDILQVNRSFPLLGTGLGTFEVVYPIYDRSSSPQVAEFADSDYLQALMEVGIVGLCLVFLFAAGILATAFRMIHKGGGAAAAISLGLLYGLVAVLVQSLSDFGQHLPSIAALSAIFCGILVALARSEGVASVLRENRQANPIVLTFLSSWRARLPRVACALLLSASMASASVDLHYRRIAASAWKRAERVEATIEASQWSGDDRHYVSLLEAASEAAAATPENAQYAFLTNYFRWQALARQALSPDSFRQELRPYAVRVRDALHSSRSLCPTYAPPLGLAGKIDAFALGQSRGRDDLRLACRLAPNDPSIQLAAGMAAFIADDDEAAATAFHKAIELDDRLFAETVDFLVARGGAAYALRFTDGDAERLVRLHDVAAKAGQLAEGTLAAAEIRRRLAACYEAGAPGNASAGHLDSLARIAQLANDEAGNAHYLARAISQDYASTSRHLELARSLKRMGRWDDARRSALLALHLSPANENAKRLLKELDSEEKRSNAPTRER